MVSISLCMIVKNEENVLARCLDSVGEAVDEIIILDTGSTDRTVEIAREYTDQVEEFPWIDDFSAARNAAFDRATSDYILWLDADDVLLETDREALRGLKETMSPDVDIVMMKYDLAFDGNGNPTYSNYRERMIRRGAGLRWVGPVHEVIPLVGNIVYAHNIAVSHKKLKPGDPARNLRILEKHLAGGGVLDPRQTFYYARELSDNGRDEDAIRVFQSFLKEEKGWLENNIEACRGLAQCYFRRQRSQEGMEALLHSFWYDAPRAEVCCDIGSFFMDRERYTQAAYWYEQARNMRPMPERGGFLPLDCYGYLPCIQLCVCYDRLGMPEKAKEMNELAGMFKPGDASVEHNRAYFAASVEAGGV